MQLLVVYLTPLERLIWSNKKTEEILTQRHQYNGKIKQPSRLND